jgi:hypothetical protein
MTTLAQILQSVLGFVQRIEEGAPMAAAPAAPPAWTGTRLHPAIPTQQDTPSQIDVVTRLNDLSVRKLGPQPRQRLDWAHSIVDLLKLLDLDSSLKVRRKLATELGYSGDPGDTGAMNTWLHAKVMDELATHGGQVPDELRSTS